MHGSDLLDPAGAVAPHLQQNFDAPIVVALGQDPRFDQQVVILGDDGLRPRQRRQQRERQRQQQRAAEHRGALLSKLGHAPSLGRKRDAVRVLEQRGKLLLDCPQPRLDRGCCQTFGDRFEQLVPGEAGAGI